MGIILQYLFFIPGHGGSGSFGDMKRNNVKIRNFLKQEKI